MDKKNKAKHSTCIFYTQPSLCKEHPEQLVKVLCGLFFPHLQAASRIFNNNTFFLCAVQMLQPLGRMPTCVDDLMDDLCDVAFKERVEEFD